ncbi:1521_t:CDS:2, partial [Rhizophagus irregularis]
MTSHNISTPFHIEENVHDHTNDFEILKDTSDDTQTIISSEKEVLNEFFEDDYEEIENLEPLYPITLEMTFTNWKKLDEFLENHGLERGFAFTITHSDKDKEDGFPRRRIYACSKGRSYNQQKNAHTDENRNRGHHTTDCKFHVNAYRRKKDNLIHITKIDGEHNHDLVDNIRMVTPHFRKLTPEMYDDVALFAACGVRAGTIIEVLQHKYPEKYIHARNIYNLVQTLRHQNQTTSDAGSMYLALMNQQQENPTFHVDARFEGHDNHLVGLCWMKLERTIERLLEKESRYVRLNETIGKLPVSQEEDYHNHYFKEVDVLCQQFLTPAVLKLQRHEMNRSMHYRCHIANLENELQKQETAESPTGMFSEDMFDACVIELAQLIADLDLTRINELWRVSSINKKSKHFIVLYDNTMHLCTCLTLISHGLVCRHFFAVMLVSSISKFHIGLIPRRWYTNAKVMEMDLIFLHTPAISVISDNEFGTVEYMVEVDLSHLENIRGHHIFTKEICQEMTRKQQWGKTFGIMKKTLDLAIETGRIEELYELHENLAKELESEMVQIVQGDHNTEFAQTISNPVRIITKGRKPKNMSGNKGKRKQIHESTNNKENNIAEELSHKKLRKALNTVDEELNVNVDGESKEAEEILGNYDVDKEMLPAKHIHIDDDSASILSFRTNSTSSSFNLSHRSSESYYQSSISKFASFQWVNNPSTHALFHWLNLKLKLPDRKQLAGPILDQAIKSIKQLRKEKLNQVHKQAGITLSFNGWKNIVNQELLGIMIILPS